MPSLPYIQLNNLSYAIESAIDFDQLSQSFSPQKYGIVGDNGTGKTTLLQLISGEIQPHAGSVLKSGTLAYCPQQYKPGDAATIAEVLNVSKQLQALARINNGSTDARDYDCVADQWDLETRITDVFTQLDLASITHQKYFTHLSGGQKTKVLLARVMLSQADFIILDEPTNNLDQASRQTLIAWIKSQNYGFLIVSHDRSLLDEMDCIVEVSNLGLQVYGGNYSHYIERKQIEKEAYDHAIHAQKEILKKAKQLAQTRREVHEQGEAKGRRGKIAQIKAHGSYDKLAFKAQQGRSEKTNRRIRIQAERKISGINDTLNEARMKVEHKHDIHADLSATCVSTKKVILEINDLCFSYDNCDKLIDNFNLEIRGPERIALTGKNGSGKTTIVKLILQKLTPQSGRINLGVEQIGYFNQEVSFLNPQHTLIEAFEAHNPDISTRDAYFTLASMNFRNKDALKKIAHLSGGEKIRAGLAVKLLSSKPPQFIILDEPTNHLDLRSIEAIESMIQQYQGAVLAISHDAHFLKNISIKRGLVIT